MFERYWTLHLLAGQVFIFFSFTLPVLGTFFEYHFTMYTIVLNTGKEPEALGSGTSVFFTRPKAVFFNGRITLNAGFLSFTPRSNCPFLFQNICIFYQPESFMISFSENGYFFFGSILSANFPLSSPFLLLSATYIMHFCCRSNCSFPLFFSYPLDQTWGRVFSFDSRQLVVIVVACLFLRFKIQLIFIQLFTIRLF